MHRWETELQAEETVAPTMEKVEGGGGGETPTERAKRSMTAEGRGSMKKSPTDKRHRRTPLRMTDAIWRALKAGRNIR